MENLNATKSVWNIAGVWAFSLIAYVGICHALMGGGSETIMEWGEGQFYCYLGAVLMTVLCGVFAYLCATCIAEYEERKGGIESMFFSIGYFICAAILVGIVVYLDGNYLVYVNRWVDAFTYESAWSNYICAGIFSFYPLYVFAFRFSRGKC